MPLLKSGEEEEELNWKERTRSKGRQVPVEDMDVEKAVAGIRRKCALTTHLYTKTSKVAGAGSGLFCSKRLEKLTCLGVYTGRVGGPRTSKRHSVNANPSGDVVVHADPVRDLLANINEPTAGRHANTWLEYAREDVGGVEMYVAVLVTAHSVMREAELTMHYGGDYEGVRERLAYAAGGPPDAAKHGRPSEADVMETLRRFVKRRGVSLESVFLAFGAVEHEEGTSDARPRQRRRQCEYWNKMACEEPTTGGDSEHDTAAIRCRTRSAAAETDLADDIPASPLVTYQAERFEGGAVARASMGDVDVAVSQLCSFLNEHWVSEGLQLVEGKSVLNLPPFGGYMETLETYDAAAQRQSTLRIMPQWVKKVMGRIPGLDVLASAALAMLCDLTGEKDLRLYDSHILKQRHNAAAGAAQFGRHRDNHDFGAKSRLRYTVICKLTADPPFAPPSCMRVLEPVTHPPVAYPALAGGCVIFRSQDLHTSVAVHPALGTVMKVAFFFK